MRVLIIFALALSACGADETKPADQAAPVVTAVVEPTPEPTPVNEPKKDDKAEISVNVPISDDSAAAIIAADERAARRAYFEKYGEWPPVDWNGEDKAPPLPVVDHGPCPTWQDPINGRCWARLTPATWPEADIACAAPWSLPTRQELWDARAHGINVALAEGMGDAYRIAWTNGVDVPLGGTLIVTVALNGSEDLATWAHQTDVRGVYCIRD